MSALNFEPRHRRGTGRSTSLTRLAVLALVTVGLAYCLWGPWPGSPTPLSRPAAPLPPPVRPIPASLPALPAEDLTVLADVRDGDPVRDLPYYFLLKRAASEVAGGMPALRVEAEDLLASPQTYRGRLVRLEGIFLREYEVDLPENLGGVRQVRSGEIGSSGGAITTFVLPRAGPSGCRYGDDVALTGWFLQVRAYVSAQDGKAHEGPLVMGQSVEWLRRPRRAPGGLALALGALAVVVLGAVVARALRGQRRAAGRRRTASGSHLPPTA